MERPFGCRLLSDGNSTLLPSEAWWDEWRRRLRGWWGLLPFASQTSMASCLGGLGLHLGSRLDAAWRGAAPGAPTPTEGVPRGAEASEADCAWLFDGGAVGAAALDALELPELPELPAAFELPALVPIPRLLEPLQEK